MLYRNSQNKKPHSLTSRIDKILKILSEIQTSTSDLESDLKEASDRAIEMASDIKTIKELRMK